MAISPFFETWLGQFKIQCVADRGVYRLFTVARCHSNSDIASSSSTQFRYQAHYGVDLGKAVAKKEGAAPAPAEVKKSKSVLKKAEPSRAVASPASSTR
jgi:hypothetical protein